MSDFLRKHLISKIKEEIRSKQKILKFEGFLFFDKEIIDTGRSGLLSNKINRVNSSELFRKEEVLPLSWYGVNGTTLLEVYSELKDNNFYIYKLYEGKSHKMRIKKRK
jgi:hypothetical protein